MPSLAAWSWRTAAIGIERRLYGAEPFRLFRATFVAFLLYSQICAEMKFTHPSVHHQYFNHLHLFYGNSEDSIVNKGNSLYQIGSEVITIVTAKDRS